MSTLQDLDLGLALVNYEPAALKEWPTGWQIEYRVLNPLNGKLQKVRVRFDKIRNRIGDDKKARRHAKQYCDAITSKLEKGWNPLVEHRNAKTFQPLINALNSFITYKEQDLQNGVFRADSMRTYRSQVTMLCDWLTAQKKTDLLVIQFNKDWANEYLDHVYMTKKLSPRTWNNYVQLLRLIWNYLIEKNFCAENPFTKIKLKTIAEKTRVVIPTEWSDKVVDYCRAHEPNLEIICLLVYNSFMRPAEICRTQIEDIKLEKGGIYLPGSKTKNGKARWCLLTPALKEKIEALHLSRYKQKDFLFAESLHPGKKALNTRDLDRYWSKMRKIIDIPAEMQLYSYRDTGITDMKKAGFNNHFIASITGHRNSDEIETYTHDPDPNALQFVMSKMKGLGEK
jgi:integrase